jgi:hypothetical protein
MKDPSVPAEWKITADFRSTEGWKEHLKATPIVVGGKDKEETADCFWYNNHYAARFKCIRHALRLRKCMWSEFETEFYKNDVMVDHLGISQTVFSGLQSPYGFWMNDTSIFVNTAGSNFLEGSNFNYSCKPSNDPGARQDYIMPDPITLSGLPTFVDCTTVVKVPTKVIALDMEWCTSLQITRNIETNSFGFKPYDIVDNGTACQIKLIDENDYIFYMNLGLGVYRFFNGPKQIACKLIADGMYTDCNGGETFPIEAKDMSYDWGADIVVTSGSFGSGKEDISMDVSFFDIFKNKLKTVIIIVVVICVIIAAIIAAIIILKLLYSYCKNKKRDPQEVVLTSSSA